MATLIQPDNTETTVLPANGVRFTLEELQKAVEGYIEFLYLEDGRVIVINEEGKLKGMKYNFKASMFGDKAGIAHDDKIVGPALICSAEEVSDEPEE